MKSFKLVGALVSALIMIGALAGTAFAGAARAGKAGVRTVVHFPANGPGGQDSHTCFWGTSYTQETRNIIWPDSHTDYPVSIDTVPAGGKIVLHGRFPHARFFSLTTSSVLGVIRGHLYDTEIKPDKGSTNPFLPGANRNATHRSYTVTVLDQPDPGPGHEAPNTLYGGITGQAPGAGPLLIVERVYLPDAKRDFSGGVGVPAATYVAADGTTSMGQAACATLQTQAGAFNLTDVNKLLFPLTKMNGLLGLSSSRSIPPWPSRSGTSTSRPPGCSRRSTPAPRRRTRSRAFRWSGPASARTPPTDMCSRGWTAGSGPTIRVTTSPCSTVSSPPRRRRMQASRR